MLYLISYLVCGLLFSLLYFKLEINRANIGAFLAILTLYPMYLFVILFIYAVKGYIYPTTKYYD